MPERIFPKPPVYTEVVSYTCDFCGQADVIDIGTRSVEGKVMHACPRCKQSVGLDQHHPYIRVPEPYVPASLDDTVDPLLLKERISLLGNALGNILVAAGVVRPDHDGLTGPHLLQFAAEYSEFLTREPDPGVFLLVMDEPAARTDGRYYVPISMVPSPNAPPGLSSSVPLLRISTDGFKGNAMTKLAAAQSFGMELVKAWNKAHS